ncbi:MAG: hypothetical protein NWE88_00030 [Candidatus Bathyarchaeota archaeon]|nr:hypothetical protein [Candidatus Bathyarchaeota archaeon]
MRQDSADLLGKADIQQSGSAELLGKFESQATRDLLGKGTIRQSGSAELLARTEIQQPGSAELLGKASITHSTELLCNAIIKNVGSAVLYARTEVGQDSGDLLAKFEAQDTRVLYAKGIVRQTDLSGLYARAEVGQGADELFARAEVGQGSVELLGRGVVRGTASSDLKGIVDITHSIDLLGRAVIGHPALPVWLKAIFSIGLTNAYRNLGSILELRRTALVELLGKTVVRHPDSEELLGNAEIKNVGSAEFLGKVEVQLSSFAELLCGFAAQGVADLGARMIIGPAKASDSYISFWDPSDWINEVVGVGQGFITIPWVEADADVKTCGNSSARLTSTYASGQYKEIRFGWGGMNWGVEAAVSPEVAPTPIDTGGRGPRRGSRAERDERREVPQSSYKELEASLTVNRLPSLVDQLRDITDADGWWQRAYGEAGLSFMLVPNADGTLTLRSHIATGSPALGGGAYGTNKAFIPTAGNPITIEWEIQCNTPVGPGSTFSIHYLGGLTDGRSTSSGTNEISLYYDGDEQKHILDIYEEGTQSYNADWTTVDITDKTKFKIIWEHPDDVAPNGRVRVYVDDVLTLTETTVVPEIELCFFFGIMLLRNAGTPTAEATLHSIAEL